ncbi:MAG: hypothetical protein U1E39_16700 [Planctomycetota bacterium]
MSRRAVPVAFAVGALFGALLTYLVVRAPGDVAPSDDAVARDAREARPAARDGDAPGLASLGKGRASADAAARDGAARAADARDGRAVVDPSGDALGDELPVVEVVVRGAAGVPDDWKGTAYALPAGASGADAELGVAHVAVTVGAPARLRVPAVGRYDVGVTWPGAFVLVEEVRVEGGSPVRVDVALPPCAPVTVIAEGEPGQADGAASGVRGGLRFVPRGDGPARSFPGRGERPWDVVEASLESVPGRATSPPLPTNASYDVEGDVYRLLEMDFGGSKATMMMNAGDERFVPTPATVRGGGEVRLVREGLGAWNLVVRLEPTPWPAPRLRARLRFTLPGGRGARDEDLDVDLAGGGVPGSQQRCAPGVARVAWSGPGIVPGEATATVGGPGSTVETTVLLRHDPSAGDEAGLPLDLTRVPAGAGPLLAVAWGGAGFLAEGGDPRASDGGPEVRQETPKPPRDLLGPGWRRATGVWLVAGDLVSRPGPPPSGGDWRPDVERGGYVAVVPDPNPESGLGTLAVRRADGLPLLSVGGMRPSGRPVPNPNEGAAPTAAFTVGVAPGTMLGPFPPGEVVLEARLGAVPLPPTTLVVRAGRVTTWTLRWRR